MPRYNIGEIPPQTVWYGAESAGATLRFEIGVEPGATLACDVVPVPRGHVSLEDGVFAYSPALGDTSDLLVGFTKTLQDGEVVRQEVMIMPRPMTGIPEAELVTRATPLPPEDSSDYIAVSQTVNPTVRVFNKIEQPTRRVHIAGKTIILSSASDTNGLHAAFGGSDALNSDIEELVVYADVLRIETPIRFPQTNVTIFARALVFTGNGSIDTTPAALDAAASGTAQAMAGHPGGSVTLNVRDLELGDPSIVRFILRGGDGQAAGQGRDGAPGASIPLIPKGEAKPDPVPQDAWDRMTYWEDVDITGGKETQRIRVGNPSARAGNGGDATPAGMPGDGGRGGELRTRVPVPEAQVVLGGGKPGQRGERRRGGDPGFPNPACHIRRVSRYRFVKGGKEGPGDIVLQSTDYEVFGRLEASRGADAEPLGPASEGAAGTVTVTGAEGREWLHPYAVQAVLTHAKDAYVTGNLPVTREILASWRDHLDAYRPTAELAPLAEQCRTEIEALIHRIDANRDYFGNPAGWVPMLSLEANFRNYENAVTSAMDVLYLAYWIQARASRKEQAVAALRHAVEKADADIQAASAEYNTLQMLIPRLQGQAGQIGQQLAITQMALEAKERELMARAEANVEERHRVPFWKQALRVLGTACKVLPVYQPVLGSIGTGLGLLSDIDTNKPLDSINQIKDLAEEFRSADFDSSKRDLDDLVGKLNQRNSENNAEYVTGLVEVGKEFRDALKKIQDATRGTQVPRDEVEAELQRIEASDAGFQELVAGVRELGLQRAEFARQVTDGLQTIAAFTGRLTAGVVAVNELNASLTDAVAQLDSRALAQIRQMERRAKETLLRFQYYLAKAYEYRMLRPFALDYRVNRTVERLRKLVAPDDKASVLSDDDYELLRGVYEEASRGPIESAIDELEKRPPEHTLPFTFGLSAAELEVLNRENAVTIDLRTKIRELASQENRRLASVKFTVVKGDPSKADADTANVMVTAEHHGVSVVRSGNRFFRFNHRSGGEYPPFTWQANFDAVQGGEPQAAKISDASLSRLRMLLGINAAEGSMVMFARPGADAELVIRKEMNTPGVDVRLTRLRLSAEIEFFPAESGNVLLTVLTSGELRPHIVCSTPDLGGRQDGRGTFTRLYNQGDLVTLRAARGFGGLTFARWADESGATITDDVSLVLSLQASRTVQALYGIGAAQGFFPLPEMPPMTFLSNEGERMSVPKLFLGPGEPAGI